MDLIKMVDDLEIPIVIQMEKRKEQFEYRMVSFVNIIKAHQGPLNLIDKPRVGARQSRIARKIGNQRAIEEYLTKVGIDGWELVTAFDYEGLPYSGTLVFKKKYYTVDDSPEESTVLADFKANLNKGNFYQKFEQETGKKAIWHGKETKGYRDWLEAKNSEKTEAVEET